jgi:hypothetical protein
VFTHLKNFALQNPNFVQIITTVVILVVAFAIWNYTSKSSHQSNFGFQCWGLPKRGLAAFSRILNCLSIARASARAWSSDDPRSWGRTTRN